jgi:hypothetical protein
MPAHKIDFYLKSSNSLRRLTEDTRRIAELHRVFLKIAPQPLTQACCVGKLRAGTLFLLAENAAIATKLKQLLPRLLASYQKQGLQVTAIRVEVQVRNAPPKAASKRSTIRLSTESIKNLEQLSASLEDSPLKRALTNMVAHQRGKS